MLYCFLWRCLRFFFLREVSIKAVFRAVLFLLCLACLFACVGKKVTSGRSDVGL